MLIMLQVSVIYTVVIKETKLIDVPLSLSFHYPCVPENWEKASAVFLEMERDDVQPDSIVCSSLMRAFNKGGQPVKVLDLAEFMREKKIPFNSSSFYEMVSACSL